jgi:hypothetical protein
MKVGDLVTVSPHNFHIDEVSCPCWFCHTNSSKVGAIISQHLNDCAVVEWDVLFDAGIYTLFTEELKVIK